MPDVFLSHATTDDRQAGDVPAARWRWPTAIRLLNHDPTCKSGATKMPRQAVLSTEGLSEPENVFHKTFSFTLCWKSLLSTQRFRFMIIMVVSFPAPTTASQLSNFNP